MITQSNFGMAFSLTLLAGLATAIGGMIAFVTKKDNLKALSISLGFSAGVMIFISLVDIIPGAENLLKTHFPHGYQWLVFGGFILGITETMVKAYLSSAYADAISYCILIVILLVKPAGLLGKKRVIKV